MPDITKLPQRTAKYTKALVRSAGIRVELASDLARRVYRHSDYGIVVSKEITQIVLDQIAQTLQDGSALYIASLGMFVPIKHTRLDGVKRPSMRDKGKIVTCKAKAHIRFKESYSLFARINGFKTSKNNSKKIETVIEK